MTDAHTIDPELVDRLRRLRGIEAEFTDFRGESHEASHETLLALLAAHGHEVGNLRSLRRDAEILERSPWTQVVPPVIVIRAGVPVPVTMIAPFLSGLHWRVQLEAGDHLAGEWHPRAAPVIAEREFDGLWYQRVELDLPLLPEGYHWLELHGPDGVLLGRCQLIVTPTQCFEPSDVLDGRRVWGPAIQLYTLRSARNWGIGDFTDLAGFAEVAAGLGADLVGLNPLHAMYPDDPDMCSPYSPASRNFLNVLYIDPEAVPEFAASTKARLAVSAPGFQRRLEELRAAPMVDYAGVTRCKLEVLRILFQAYESDATDERRAEFEAFRTSQGKDLERLAMYFACRTRPTEGDAFEGEPDTGRFHSWLQWIASTQLAEARDRARRAGMSVGLYLDLAVGASNGSAEAGSDPELYAIGATIGAPPDPLALQGQDWGIPPTRPDILRARAYEPFIRLLRANMQHGGALRIDHVMAMSRLWWVPAGRSSAEGSYVRYPLEDLLGILALESQRNRCIVIGEDLGTVPPGFRDTLAAHRVYSYRVLFFERSAEGEFRSPDDYPRAALATVTTHDLPTLASFWSGSDIDLRQALGVYAEPVATEQRAARRQALVQLQSALNAVRLWPAEAGGDGDTPVSFELVSALQLFLAHGNAALLAVQPEDWALMENPVNVPGTHMEYPNWRRKMTIEWPVLLAGERVQALCRALSAARTKERQA